MDVNCRCPACGWSLAYTTEDPYVFVCGKCAHIFYYDATEELEVAN